MEIFTNHPWAWGFVLLSLLGLVYTMVVIKEEKTSFKESALPFSLKNFSFLIPSWWSEKATEENSVSFERKDTRYDWEARFTWHDSFDESLSIVEQTVALIKKQNIEFDEIQSVVKNPSDFAEHKAYQSGQAEIARIEGTATKNGIERKYLDIFVVRDLKRKGYLLAVSESSILNGLLEGPYFEDVMYNFSIQS